MGNTALGFLKAGFVEILYSISLRSIHAGNVMDLKSGIPLTEQKGKRHWLLDKVSLTGLQKLYRQLNKRKTVLKLIFFVLFCLKCSFCGTWLGLMLVLVDLLFCRKVKMYT